MARGSFAALHTLETQAPFFLHHSLDMDHLMVQADCFSNHVHIIGKVF